MVTTNDKLMQWGKEPIENDKGKYVAVKVKNAQELYSWYSNQGIEVVPADELHCTIAYSKKDFEYEVSKEDIFVSEFNTYLEPLGDDGAVVLKIHSQELQDRFNRCMLAGATYDYPSYKPHITISYKEIDNIKDIKQPDFNIILGDEYTNPLNENWKDSLCREQSERKKDLEEKMENEND